MPSRQEQHGNAVWTWYRPADPDYDCGYSCVCCDRGIRLGWSYWQRNPAGGNFLCNSCYQTHHNNPDEACPNLRTASAPPLTSPRTNWRRVNRDCRDHFCGHCSERILTGQRYRVYFDESAHVSTYLCIPCWMDSTERIRTAAVQEHLTRVQALRSQTRHWPEAGITARDECCPVCRVNTDPPDRYYHYHPNHTAINNQGGRINWICEECHRRGQPAQEQGRHVSRVVCDHCGRTVPPIEINDVGCERCTFVCSHCNDRQYRTERVNVYGVGPICRDCSDNGDYCSCEDCGIHIELEAVYYDDCEVQHCPDCFRGNHEEDTSCLIHNYDYRPQPRFILDQKPGNRLAAVSMGVELETSFIEGLNACAKDVLDVGTAHYLKDDSSLRKGFEVVSHPATLKQHIENMGWPEICKVVRKYEGKSHDGEKCGLHIHLDRKFFAPITDRRRSKNPQELPELKLSSLFFRCWQPLQKFSRRTDSQVLDWARPPRAEGLQSPAKFKAYKNNCGRGAVNLCCCNTVEIRLWRGTLNINSLFAAFEMTDGLARYVKTHNIIQIKNTEWNDLCAWIMDSAHTQYLKPYLEKRKLLKCV